MLATLRHLAARGGLARAALSAPSSSSALAPALAFERDWAPAARSFSSGADAQGQESSSVPRIVVFGGNGYVGTHVCQAALNMGLAVTSVSRSGRPTYSMGHWGDQVDWLAADAMEPEAYASALEGASGVVCCIGGFGSHETMIKVNGETNITALRAAAEAGVPRAAFVSAHDYKLPDFVLGGYFQGKRNAEQAMQSLFPHTGVILRPGFIYGTRMVGTTGLPLGVVGQPLEKVLGLLPSKALAGIPLAGAGFVPPVSVEAVAKVAVMAVSDTSVPPGILDPWQLQEMGRK